MSDLALADKVSKCCVNFTLAIKQGISEFVHLSSLDCIGNGKTSLCKGQSTNRLFLILRWLSQNVTRDYLMNGYERFVSGLNVFLS